MSLSREQQLQRASILTILVSFFLLFCASSVSANPNWNSWGNAGIDYVGTFYDNVLFGSNYPQGNLNFSLVTTTNNQGYSPIIADFDYDGQNEIATFYASVVKLYDNDGNILSSYDVNGTLCGHAVLMNLDEDKYPDIGFMTSVTGGYRYYNMEAEGGTWQVNKERHYTYGTTLACTLFGGIDASVRSEVYTVTTPNDVIKYNFDTDVITVYNRTFASYTSSQSAAGSYFFGSGLSSGKVNGWLNIYWMASPGGSGTPVRAMRFSELTDAITYKASGIVTGAAALENYEAMFTNIGSTNSDPEVVLFEGATNGNQATIEIMDYSLSNILYSVTINQVQNTPQFPAVADINKDGSNELCFWSNAARNITCVTATGSQVLTTQLTHSPNSFFSLGSYDDTSAYMNIITSRGVYAVNTTANATLVYPFLTNSTTCMTLPVAIENAASFKKDILSVCTDKLDYYIGQSTPAVCGNGICEYSENVWTCPDDCGPDALNETIGSLTSGSPCSQNSDCVSGICTGGICEGKPGGVGCSSDAECLSGVCDPVVHICTRVDIKDQVTHFADLLGFSSTLSKLLLAILVIIAFTIGGISAGSSYGSLAAGVGGLVGFVGALFITILVFGWVGVWVVFIFAFLVLAGLMLILKFSGTGGG